MSETRDTILIADDEDDIRGMVAEIAAEVFPDARIEQFESAAAIIERMREVAGRVFLVITDGSMPRKNRGMGEKVARAAVDAGIPNVVHFSGDDPKYITVPASVVKIEKGQDGFQDLRTHLETIQR